MVIYLCVRTEENSAKFKIQMHCNGRKLYFKKLGIKYKNLCKFFLSISGWKYFKIHIFQEIRQKT